MLNFLYALTEDLYFVNLARWKDTRIMIHNISNIIRGYETRLMILVNKESDYVNIIRVSPSGRTHKWNHCFVMCIWNISSMTDILSMFKEWTHKRSQRFSHCVVIFLETLLSLQIWSRFSLVNMNVVCKFKFNLLDEWWIVLELK